MKHTFSSISIGIFASILFPLALYGNPSALDPNAILELNPKHGGVLEIVAKNQAVAGSTVIGFMKGSLTAAANFQYVDVNLPPAQISSLCLEVRSVDGAYTGRAEYDIPQPFRGGYYRLNYPSTSNYLHNKFLIDVAVLLTDAAECKRRVENVAYIATVSSDEKSRTYAYINSGTATHLKVVLNSDTKLVNTICSKYDGEYTTVNYNNICELPETTTPNPASTCDINNTLTIQRKKFTTWIKPDLNVVICR